MKSKKVRKLLVIKYPACYLGKVKGYAKPYIDTIRGRAYYSHTEKEDKYGRWNDNWYTVSGEFVIHEGKYHHVYILR